VAIKPESITKRIPPARKRPKKRTEKKPPAPVTLSSDELLEYKVRMIIFATARDAYALWTRTIKTKYKVDQGAILDIHPGTGELRIRKTVAESVQSDG
jgi:hypothetical protein